MGDAMRLLENRANDSKQDMDVIAALEEMRSMKSRHAGVSVDQMLEILKHSAHLKIEDDDGDDEGFGMPDQSNVTAKINGSSESVLNPTDVLTKTNGPESSNKEGNKTVASKMPIFIVKPKTVGANPQKKQKMNPQLSKITAKHPPQRKKVELQKRRPMFFSSSASMIASKVMTEDNTSWSHICA
uniref:Uncharacterized protein n=1 Tax=Aegilops tauschii subsp. strangulata TaxID=200361 RepID=A0A453CEF7_AEGTS